MFCYLRTGIVHNSKFSRILVISSYTSDAGDNASVLLRKFHDYTVQLLLDVTDSG